MDTKQSIVTHSRDFDPVGMETLQVIAQANHFNRWMYDTIRPFCKGKVLEIGSGIGNISEFFINDSCSITLSDFRESYCEELRKTFSRHSTPVVQIDLVHPDFNNEYKALLNSFDTVFALNVVEHIEDDVLALHNCHSLLRTNGVLVILVPAYQGLYNTFDINLGHYRRYTKALLNEKFRTSDFQILQTQYFNAAGILGWLVTGNLLKKNGIPGHQMKLFNKLVGLFKIVDLLLLKSLGLSVISVGKKVTIV